MTAPPPRQVEIEQALAWYRGDVDRVCADLNIPPGEVRRVQVYLDTVNSGADVAGTGRNQPPARHGTHSGYVTHRRRHEAACEPCLAAERVYDRERKRRRKDAA